MQYKNVAKIHVYLQLANIFLNGLQYRQKTYKNKAETHMQCFGFISIQKALT